MASSRPTHASLPIQALLVLLTLSASVTTVTAHPGAINMAVDRNVTPFRLYPLPTYEPGAFRLFPGIELSSETPGMSVSFPANGLAAGTRLELEIAEGLLYWDGTSITAAPTSLRIEGPQSDNEGNPIVNGVDEYVISPASRVRQGMTWGTYTGNNFWEADGLFFLTDMQAPLGIYGLAYRILSPSYAPSDPFMIPIIYDPNNQWNVAQRQAGINQLTQAMRPFTADFDRDGIYGCSDVDALVAEIVSGTHMAGFDLTRDGMVTTADLQEWLADAGSARLASHAAFLPGDANLDGVVDGSDFSVWNSRKFTSQAGWCGGDFSADGVVDGSDFGIWNSRKFTSADGSLIPEPGGAFCWLLPLLALSLRRNPRGRGSFLCHP